MAKEKETSAAPIESPASAVITVSAERIKALAELTGKTEAQVMNDEVERLTKKQQAKPVGVDAANP